MQETYTIYGKEYPVTGHANIVNEAGEVTGTLPIVDIPMMSDYRWQLNCLKSRLAHPEIYKYENVDEVIEKLCKWLSENKAKATEKRTDRS